VEADVLSKEAQQVAVAIGFWKRIEMEPLPSKYLEFNVFCFSSKIYYELFEYFSLL
jgi:hypothetical protein